MEQNYNDHIKNCKSIFRLDYYSPDPYFIEALKFKCLLIFPEERGFKFRDLFANIPYFSRSNLKYKLASISFMLLIVTGLFYFNYSSNLSSDFVIAQVYAENTQTNLMPFMMLSSNFNSFDAANRQNLNPAFLPLVGNIKKYNFGHVGYEVRKGDSMEKCKNLYPFPDDVARVEAYEYLGDDGSTHYKIFTMSRFGKIENFMMLNNGEMMKVETNGSLTRADIRSINRDSKIEDIIGKMPKTINVEKRGRNYIMISWQKKVICQDVNVENMLINILVDSRNYKIKNLSTYTNAESEENLIYSIDFVSNTQMYKFDDVKSNFEYVASEVNLL